MPLAVPCFFSRNIARILVLFLLLGLAFVGDFGDFVGPGTTQVLLLLLLPFLCCIWFVVFLVDETRHHATTQTGMNTHTDKTKREQQSERERERERERDGRILCLAISLSAETAMCRGSQIQVVHLHTAVSSTRNITQTPRKRHDVDHTVNLVWDVRNSAKKEVSLLYCFDSLYYMDYNNSGYINDVHQNIRRNCSTPTQASQPVCFYRSQCTHLSGNPRYA